MHYPNYICTLLTIQGVTTSEHILTSGHTQSITLAKKICKVNLLRIFLHPESQCFKLVILIKYYVVLPTWYLIYLCVNTPLVSTMDTSI